MAYVRRGRGVGQADLTSWGYISPCGPNAAAGAAASTPSSNQVLAWGGFLVAGLVLVGLFGGSR